MFKNKYYYDKEKLSYLPIKTGKVRKISNFFLFLVSSLIFGIFILFGLLHNNIVNTPKEVLQQRELNSYEFQIDILNKKLDEIESVLTNIEDRDNNLYRIYFEASPIPEEQRRTGFGGINRYKDLEGYENSELIINLTERLDILTKQIVIQSRSLEEIESLSKSKKKLLEAIPSIQPVKNEDVKRIKKQIDEILGAKSNLREKLHTKKDQERELFCEVLRQLQFVNARTLGLKHDFKLNMVEYDDPFYIAIESLIKLQFNQEQRSIINWWIYDKFLPSGDILI